MQIGESQRIIITAWLKCTLNKVHVHGCRLHRKLSEGREVLQKFTHLEAAFFARFKRVLISLFTVTVFLAEQHLNHM